MGRGRTTTGMVIATLIYFNRIGASGEFLLAFDSLILTVILDALLSLGYADRIEKRVLSKLSLVYEAFNDTFIGFSLLIFIDLNLHSLHYLYLSSVICYMYINSFKC